MEEFNSTFNFFATDSVPRPSLLLDRLNADNKTHSEVKFQIKEKDIEKFDDVGDEEDVVREQVRRGGKRAKKNGTKSNEDSEGETETGDADGKEPESTGAKYRFSEEVYSAEGTATSWSEMRLSRALLRALRELNFETPTAIQRAAIPLALGGHDVCACAKTGTGKSLAFLVPLIERLLLRGATNTASVRALVIAPTRELALQLAETARALIAAARASDAISVGYAVGGLDLAKQRAALRRAPALLVATPGRLVDQLRNAPAFALDRLEVLVLDEADRVLDDSFAAELSDILAACPRSRQVFLFSATMTDRLADLLRVGLRDNVVKVFLSEESALIGSRLRQEFVLVRGSERRTPAKPTVEADEEDGTRNKKNRKTKPKNAYRESSSRKRFAVDEERDAVVVSLLHRTFTRRVLVFAPTRELVHRLYLILKLFGFRVGELRGDMKQPDRVANLAEFHAGHLDVLVCTDLAARGLDIERVETVINHTMPNTLKAYVHRVGRTARNGERGTCVSLVARTDRKVLKEIVKRVSGRGAVDQQAVHFRAVAKAVVSRLMQKLVAMRSRLAEVEQQEREQRMIEIAERDARRAENMILHADEIMARPKRTYCAKRRAPTDEARGKPGKQRGKHRGEAEAGSGSKPTRKRASVFSSELDSTSKHAVKRIKLT